MSPAIYSQDRVSSLTFSFISDKPTIAIYHHDVLVSELTFVALPQLQLNYATDNSFSLSSSNGASLTVAFDTDGSNLFDIVVRNPNAPFVELQLPLGQHSWYGLGHFMHQQWPLEKLSFELSPFYPFDNGPTGVNTLADPTLISTSGLFIKIDDSSPCLHLGLNAPLDSNPPNRVWTTGSLNQERDELPLLAEHADDCDNLLRVQSRALFDLKNVSHPWMETEEENGYLAAVPELRLQVGTGANVREASELSLHALVVQDQTLRETPPLYFMQRPIWTTWVRYGAEIDQGKVIEFAKEIVLRNLPRSVMEIDDRWSVKYGDLMFDATKFPSPGDMVEQLHSLGFRVTLWVIPFANLDSDAVTNRQTKHFFIHNADGTVGKFKWWQPTEVAALDLTNDRACEWFVSRLERLRSLYGIDGFKFDAGEASFTPHNSMLQEHSRTPADYTRLWVHKVAARFELSEVRAGVQRCQAKSPMSRILDRYSTWTLKNGLASVITSTLTSGILGYPFVLPDMIGGNAYGDDRPDSELMIRWTQLNAALPALQFSVAPWDLGKTCDELCRTALHWREDFFWSHIVSTHEAARDGYVPIIRPMWWADQSDEMKNIDDQFMVGDDLLVAPVVIPDAKKRSVKVPSGMWRRVQLRGVAKLHDLRPFRGSTEVIATAALDDMPVFVRVSE